MEYNANDTNLYENAANEQSCEHCEWRTYSQHSLVGIRIIRIFICGIRIIPTRYATTLTIVTRFGEPSNLILVLDEKRTMPFSPA